MGEDSDGLYEIELVDFDLDESDPFASTLSFMGFRTDQVSFIGTWDPDRQTYANYEIQVDLGLSSDIWQQQGRATLTAQAGVDGFARLRVEGFDSLVASIEQLDLTLQGIDGQALDPYTLTKTLPLIFSDAGLENPLVFMDLINTYSDQIFHSNLDLALELDGLNVDIDSDVFALETGQFRIEKRGQSQNGPQSFTLIHDLNNLESRQGSEAFSLSAITGRHSLSLTDIGGLIPQLLPLGLQASGIDSP